MRPECLKPLENLLILLTDRLVVCVSYGRVRVIPSSEVFHGETRVFEAVGEISDINNGPFGRLWRHVVFVDNYIHFLVYIIAVNIYSFSNNILIL